jgi:hypothetical protein
MRIPTGYFLKLFGKMGHFEEFTKTCKRRSDGLNAPVKLALGTNEPNLFLMCDSKLILF